MHGLQTAWIPKAIRYDGQQLRPHWIYNETGILGHSLIAFEGEADVQIGEMVDLEDVKAKKPIYSPRMLHFLGEFFIDSFDLGIQLQWNFLHTVMETLTCDYGILLKRKGNDLFFRDRKLSVSIAARSPVSVLLHVGVNVDTEGTPIPTSGLRELDVEPQIFAAQVFARWKHDCESWVRARVKASPR